MSVYITGGDGFEAAMAADRKAMEAAIASMTPEQQGLCDGKEHFAFFIDPGPNLAAVHIRSHEQVLAEYPEEAYLWFDPDGRITRGYLPCEFWDAYYERPIPTDVMHPEVGLMIVEGDPHDCHASTLLEITREEFTVMVFNGCVIDVLLSDPHYVNLLNRWITMNNERNAR